MINMEYIYKMHPRMQMNDYPCQLMACLILGTQTTQVNNKKYKINSSIKHCLSEYYLLGIGVSFERLCHP